MKYKRTVLHDQCLNAGARMVPFAGWEMPLQFSGVLKEHHAVRKTVGIFDISHMGIILLEGENPKDLLQRLVPTDLYRIGTGEACYTLLLNESGGIIDDIIIYDLGNENSTKESLLIINNAACFDKDINWIKKYLDPKKVTIKDGKGNKALIAVQGPQALETLEDLFKDSLKSIPRFGHRKINLCKDCSESDNSILLARTGYTGEDGFELLIPGNESQAIWQALIEKGATPCGLGARDTLRLEAAMHLYGQDMDSQSNPFEAGLGWLVHLEMAKDFVGREALEEAAQAGIKRRLIGLQLDGRAIARNGYSVLLNDKRIGTITSGSWSPTLGKAIALAYVNAEAGNIGNSLQVDIRGTKYPASIVKKPFYKRLD